MKRLITICLVCVLTAAVSQGMTISFDENGNGFYPWNGQNIPLTSGKDTPPGGTWDTLYYDIAPDPWALAGDVVIYEDSSQNEISDLLRFVDVPNNTIFATRIYVYSEIDPGEQPPYDLADTGIPAGPYSTNAVYLIEQGAENGWNGVNYDPAQYQGAPGSGYSQTYYFTSDVPEPATICLLGLSTLAFFRNRKA